MFSKLESKLTLPLVANRKDKKHYFDSFNLAFKQKFHKMLRMNFQVLVFFLPVLAVLVMGSYTHTAYINKLPFATNIGLGYYPIDDLHTVADLDLMLINTWVYLSLIPLFGLGGIGISGVLYVFKKFVAVEDDVEMFKDFLKGIKQNGVICMLCFMILGLCLFLIRFNIDYATVYGSSFFSVLTIVASCLFALFMMLFLTFFMTLSKEIAFKARLKNSILLIFTHFPFSVLMILVCYAPFILTMTVTAVSVIGVVFYLLVGFYYTGAAIASYTEYVFNLFAPLENARQVVLPTKKRAKKKR